MRNPTRHLPYVALCVSSMLAIILSVSLGTGIVRACTLITTVPADKVSVAARHNASGGGPANHTPNSSPPDGEIPLNSKSGITPLHPLWDAAINIKDNNLPLTLECLRSFAVPRCYSPQQIRQAYGITPLLQAGITGKDRVITLIQAFPNPTLRSDLALFNKIFGLNDAPLNIITPFGTTPFNPNDPVQTAFAGENALEIEWAHALAPDATINVIEGNIVDDTLYGQLNALLQATAFAVHNNIGSVISQSFGLSEQCLSAPFLQEAHQIFQQARVQKQTVFASTGDAGSASIQCNQTGNIETIAQGISYPASDPLVTSVGGTSLQAGADGTYIGEVAWNESLLNEGATGGGFSKIFVRPPFQKHIDDGKTRGIADIAFNGDPFTGVPIVTSSLIPGLTLLIPVGGTSLGAPAVAAMTALFEQAAGNIRLGFLNSALYRIQQDEHAYAATFHDITQGNNTFFYVAQKQKISIGQIAGYDAQPGWDAPTGLGSMIANTMAEVLPAYIRDDDGSTL
jgi:Predicted protease